MKVKIDYANIKKRRTFIDAQGRKIPEEQFFGGNFKSNLGTAPGTKDVQSIKENKEDKKN